MASVTLAESAKLSQNDLVAGIIENIITVNRFYELLPFDSVEGNALAYNRELALGDVVTGTVGTTLTDGAGKAAATFTQVTSSLTTILGDAEVNGMIQATRSGINDQTATQIASKAKAAGRKYQNLLINGAGTGNDFTGLLTLVDSTQSITPTTDGDNLSFTILDELLDLVVDKDGEVDYIQMHARTIRSYNALLRALGGASVNEVVELPSGAMVPAYRGVPIFRNDYIPITQTTGSTTGSTTTILAGTLDDGSRTHGIAGLTAAEASGIQVVDVGEKETSDDHIWRVKWYCGLANFSVKGLAARPGIKN